MAPIPHQLARRIGLLAWMVMSGLLIAHSFNAFVADALSVIPEEFIVPETNSSIRPASYSPAQYVEEIRSSGLFILPSSPAGMAGQEGTAATPVLASLGAITKLRLIGVVLGDRRGVFAIVEELASKKQGLYRLHDEIPELGEVTEIRRDGIVIRQGNIEELVELTPSENPAVATPGPPTDASPTSGTSTRKVIDRREVELAMGDLPKLLTQARAVQNTVNGSVNGFRIDYIAPTSFYEKIGVQAGDVLQRVNGVDIRDPSMMLSLLQQLKNERVVKLEMIRNNQPSTITYELR